jgi:hypothetical protein
MLFLILPGSAISHAPFSTRHTMHLRSDAT